MDSKTLTAYAHRAEEYSAEWLAQPPPTDIYELIKKFFKRGGKTIDVGCGSGRDTNWLNENGYPTIGVDSTKNLIEQATLLYPNLLFQVSNLPELTEVKQKFENVFCETVVMHLSADDIKQSVLKLKSLLNKGGVIYLSWRVTESNDFRDLDGRLYTAFEPALILDLFENEKILHFEEKISLSSGKKVCRLIASL